MKSASRATLINALLDGRWFPWVLGAVSCACLILFFIPRPEREAVDSGESRTTRVSVQLGSGSPFTPESPLASADPAPARPTIPGPTAPSTPTSPASPGNPGDPGDSGPPSGITRRDYLSGIIRKVARHKRFPRVEKERDQQGEVIVGFVILADGRIENLRLIRPSQYSGFNDEALASVHRSVPFPAIPLELGKNRLSLRIKLKFRLSDG